MRRWTIWAAAAELGAAVLGTAMPGAAGAQGISVSADVVSDYRFRGISQSGKDPAVQANVEWQSASGFKLGTWASTLGGKLVDGRDFADGEIDLYGGWEKEVAGVRYALTGYAYFYPGSDGFSYAEVQGEVGYTLGPAEARVYAAYTPDQFGQGSDNLYLGGGLSAGIPTTPVTLEVRGGYEDGLFDHKIDWEANVSMAMGPFNASVAYIDTNRETVQRFGDAAGATVVGKIGIAF